ncbi:MAG TPA: ATP-binding protein [Nocardioidaceae bacterium]|jgi:DNA replication protein DnaC|nr:ATP-binding protein [Nocardioidaceae bacterium]
MEILEAYDLTGCAWSAAELAGCDAKTITRYVSVRDRGGDPYAVARRARLIDPFLDKVEELVDRSEGKVRADKVHEPGMWLQFDWGQGPRIDGRQMNLFCVWLAWSRFRLVIPTWDRTLGTFACLDSTLRTVGGAPTYLLTDNEKTVTIEHVAGVAVRHPEMVAAGRHYGCKVETCVPYDPESKGGSESTVKVAKRDLVPTQANLLEQYASFAELAVACEQFGAKVNARVHRETGRAPVDMLTEEQPRLQLVVLRRMRLPYVRAAAPEVLATARAQRWDPAEVLRVLLAEEAKGRDAATQRMRRKAAGFPTGKTFGSWREQDSSIEPATQSALRTLEWVGRAENLSISGPSGTGKSHFVEALAHTVIDADMRVAWFTLESLTATIGRARVDASIAKVVARICRSDLIVIDDIGSLPAGQDAAEAFYRVVDAAYERRSVAVTSNIKPAGFDTIMPKTLATTTVDRLLHHAHQVLTDGRSQRLAEALAGKGVVPLT